MSSVDLTAAAVDIPEDQAEEPRVDAAIVPPTPQEQPTEEVEAPAALEAENAETKDVDTAPIAEGEPQDAAASPTETVEVPTPSAEQPPAEAATSSADSRKKVAFAQPTAPTAKPASSSRTRTAPHSALSSQAPRIDLRAPSSASNAVLRRHVADADAMDVYTRSEAERIAAVAATLTPNTALGVFRRGGDNSHTNRMEIGSYSRYLLSTDHMPPIVLNETFHGEQPTLGPVPRTTVRPRNGATWEEDAEVAAQQQRSQRNRAKRNASNSPTASAEARRAHRSFSYTGSISADGQMNTTWNSTAGSGTLKRELNMLGDATFADLDAVRDRRRRDPRKGKPEQAQLDYVYYNHKSKGFYIPHDPSPETTMLLYNHMYNFGDGTRFAPLATSLSASGVPQQEDSIGTGSVYRRNPHAAPPRSFAETRGCTFPLTASQRHLYSNSSRHIAGRQSNKDSADATATTKMSEAEVAQQQQRRQRAGIQSGSSSLRTAKAIDLARLHRTQCPRPRTIEEVLADQQRHYPYDDGAPHPPVQDIKRDVHNGKSEWEEVPAALQPASTDAAVQRGIHEPYPRTCSSGKHHKGSLSQPLNGLVDVMGHLRPVPAIVAANAARSTNGSSTMGAAAAAVATDGVTLDESHPASIEKQSGKSVDCETTASASLLPAISH
ncbi:hypothetical protein ABL78_2264 [Leptomonas seymouri]|uniref:Uncharacterized protein n=1 Tax=Leptomonas seymouri TaxID=5684 RepID=A0A0N1I7T9_LEPSE|nr:hypothetical protein ABL78_2264 [Leptomonas seymouri]|eukprot:KPI88660.1 hypothetical protein ABL78_2264 [Leptomonas seymouri]